MKTNSCKLVEQREELAAMLGKGNPVWFLEVQLGEERVEALVDTGASRSFISPSLVVKTKVEVEDLDVGVKFQVASGEDLFVYKVAKAVELLTGGLRTWVDLLVTGIPYEIILGMDWLVKESIVCDFGSQRISAKVRGQSRSLPVKCQRSLTEDERCEESKDILKQDRNEAAEARVRMVEDVNKLSGDDAAALVRPAPKRYKNFKKKKKMVPIKQLLRDLKVKGDEMKESVNVLRELTLVDLTSGPLHGSPRWRETEAQGTAGRTTSTQRYKFEGNTALPFMGDEMVTYMVEGEAPTYLKFEAWLQGEGQGCPKVIKEVICEFKDLFMDKLPPGLPPERVIDHTITLLPGKMPSKGALYKLGREELEAQREILTQLKAAKWITLTSSPFAAPSMIVGKKDDSSGKRQFRMVVNYQELNSMTISPEYPLPTIQDILDMLHGARIFTIMDMEQGFHQIRVAPTDQYKTAFRTCMGQYEFKVMPFGLRGAPGTFQTIMNEMFFHLIGRGVIAYLDDLLVYSPDEESHARLLRKVLKILRDNKMYPKISKCHFGAAEIEYLGYKVTKDGIIPSPEKVKAIEVWPEELTNESQVKQFLGTVNYCRMFMGPAFADLAKPLVELTKKGVDFKWENKHTQALKALKHQLANYVTLQMPDPAKPFVLKTDASGYAVGAVLEQEGKPLGFLSKKMSPAEVRYATYDQELLALIRALEKWRQLLLTADVTVYTDHRALQYLLTLKGSKPIRGRIARWMLFLSDFQKLKIVYQPGAGNVVADALSRNPLFENPDLNLTNLKSEEPSLNQKLEVEVSKDILCTLTEHQDVQVARLGRYHKGLVPVTEGDKEAVWHMRIGSEAWNEALRQCTDFGEIYKQAQETPGRKITAELNGSLRRFKTERNLLFIQFQGLWRICVPNSKACRQYIMYQVHDHPTAGHMGVKKTYDFLARQFYWPGIRAYARTYVESCTRCRAAKNVSLKQGGLLQSLQIPSRRWQQVSMDFITGLPPTPQQHDAILTLVDTVSKMAHFIPTKTTVSAEGVVSLLADRLVRYHGLPSVIVSDRDPRFVAELWELFCKRFQIKRALSSAWHPQTDGQTERVHRTIEQVLRTYIQSEEAEWEVLLPAAELAYNCTVHNSTGLTPFEVMIGENPLRACDLDIVDDLEPTISPPMTKLFQQLVDRAATHISQAQQQQKFYADQRRREVEFQPGEDVWLSTKFMQPRGSAKFQPRFIGPFKVLNRVGKVAYKLDLPPSMQHHPVFHVSLLQRDKPRPSDMLAPEGWKPTKSVAVHGEAQYEVEHLLDSRKRGNVEEFLVKWKGFPDADATWEPLENLKGSKDLIKAFRKTRTRQKKKKHT